MSVDLLRPDDTRPDAEFDTGLTALLTDSEETHTIRLKLGMTTVPGSESRRRRCHGSLKRGRRSMRYWAAQAKAEGRPVSPLKDIPTRTG